MIHRYPERAINKKSRFAGFYLNAEAQSFGVLISTEGTRAQRAQSSQRVAKATCGARKDSVRSLSVTSAECVNIPLKTLYASQTLHLCVQFLFAKV